MRYQSLIIMFVLVVALCGCGRNIEKCQSEGRRYYRAIGSYPTLSDGDRAEDLIRDHCRANPEMFADMPY